MERLGALLVCAFTLQTVVAVTLTSSGSTEAGVGGNAVFTCRVTGLSLLSQTVKWAKVDNKDPRVTKEISNHISVHDTVHHSIEATQEGGDFVYKFTIKDVQKSDDGAYKCFVEEKEKIVAETKETLTVKQPVASLEFQVGPYKIDSSEDGVQEFELDRFDPNLVLNCKVRGSNPAAQVMVKIGETDVTPKLRREDQMVTNGKTLESIRAYNTDLDSTGVYSLDPSVVGKEMSCSAWLEGDEGNKREAKALLKVKEPPKVECGNVTTRPGNRRVMIECTIKSLVEPEKISWFVDNEDNPMFVPATDVQMGEYRAKTSKDGENQVKVSLEIGLVAEKHFDTIYELRAKVSQNDLSHVVRLHMRGSIGGQGRVTIATSLLGLAVLAGCLLM
ncbi:uncharacterized protein LOC135478073 isoform X2 [Liolophura sinensis]|uniref:uncharacterized protein LOC135478073 isoform X2 n=1 Tax=Liolophura sinensis TaxID=3198878 RepID=UPI003158B420